MSIRERNKLESHDNAGFESEIMKDFSEYDDGNGNNVATGDKSMQRMVEGGVRDAVWPLEVPEGKQKAYAK